MQKLYTSETLAELLQVSPRTIRRERKEGRLPFVRVRGQMRYRESDVRSYLERNASMSLDTDPFASQANWGDHSAARGAGVEVDPGEHSAGS